MDARREIIRDGAVAVDGGDDRRGRQSRRPCRPGFPTPRCSATPTPSSRPASSTPTSTSPAIGWCARASPTISRPAVDLRLGGAGARAAHRRRRRAVGHAVVRRAGQQRHHDRRRGRHRRAPRPVAAALRNVGHARHGRHVGLGRRRGAVRRAGGRGARAPSATCSSACAAATRRGLGHAGRPRPDERRAGGRRVGARARPAAPVSRSTSRRAGDAVAYLARIGVARSCTSTTRRARPARAARPRGAPRRRRVRDRAAHDAVPSRQPWAYLRLGQGVTAHGATASCSAAAHASRSAATPRTPATRSILPRRRARRGHRQDQRSIRRASARTTRSSCPRSAAPMRSAWRTASDRLEPGKQADLVVHDTSGPQWAPRSTDPVLQLVWASDGRSVRDVLVAGRVVVRDGRCTTVDLDALRDAAARRRPGRLLRASRHRSAVDAWPVRLTAHGLTIRPMLGSRAMALPEHPDLRRLPVDDPEATGAFYAEVFGWEVEGRPTGVFHRIVPGQNFPLPDGDSAVAVGNLHMGIYDVNDGRPNPRAARAIPTPSCRAGAARGSGSSSSDDDTQDRILDAAEKHGAKDLVARPLLGRVQRLQRRVRRSVGHRDHPVDQGRRRSARSRKGSPVSDDRGCSRIGRATSAPTAAACAGPTSRCPATTSTSRSTGTSASRRSNCSTVARRRRLRRLARPSRSGRQAVHPRAGQLLPRSGQGPAADHGAVRPHRHRGADTRRGRTHRRDGRSRRLPACGRPPTCPTRSATSAPSPIPTAT